MERRDFLALLSAALILPSGLARAHRPSLKVLVRRHAGGGTDIVARSLSAELEQRLSDLFIVENRGGAAGNIAATPPWPRRTPMAARCWPETTPATR